MKEITELEPKALWKQFAKVCSIPHPSKHEEKLRQYVIDFAQSHGLEYRQDAVGNVVVRKPAAAGYEGHPTVVLQAHMDMVPQKNSDLKFNFETDPIRPYVDGEWVTADGTTLGADDGMGVSAMLAVLEGKDIPHPALECLFTVDEETGLTGANQLGDGMLSGDILINLDSEDEGELYVGCAGAVNVTANFEYKEVATPDDSVGYEVALSGLKGGHSGMEIILQRGNANKLLTRFLRENPYVRISTIDAGGLRNAIPREARAIVAVPVAQTAGFEKAAEDFEQTIRREFALVEDSIRFGVRRVDTPAIVAACDFQTRFVAALTAMPNGIMRMSDAVPGLVETSTNMSRVQLADGKAQLLFMVRCMVNYGKKQVVAMIESVASLAGGRIETQGDYDGWAPNPDSKILHVMKEGYEKLFGRMPEVKAIHAGLECGIIGAKYPQLDMVSVGPTMRYPHSPDEKVEIASVVKFYDFLLYTLKNL
ncbi:aminoacyl-histidine dipeptidase [uncultured Rikenella sp.]|uniref:aminoacyl-histidine dipeptidase n=1 Tax=uncultured Rikenella sp. TaxID=368003 RepID=UPI002606FC9D|nr:aminoacyl-histidine dipeptidase [uncultured Rikenella sp.]